jgi:hypothetical protein
MLSDVMTEQNIVHPSVSESISVAVMVKYLPLPNASAVLQNTKSGRCQLHTITNEICKAAWCHLLLE